MDDYARLAGLVGIATGDAGAALEVSVNAAKREGQLGDDSSKGIVSVPANFGLEQEEERARLESLGFTLLDEPSADRKEREQSFVRLQIPDGWYVSNDSDSGGRVIFDERGIKRVSMYDNGQWWDRYVSTVVIRQRHEIPLRLVYGTGDLQSVLWDKLTDAEKEEVKDGLRGYIVQGDESPSVYADTAAKAKEWLKVIEALPS